MKCGYKWTAKPNTLFSGHGCHRCSGCERYTTESFRERIKWINPYIEVVGEYVNNHTKIRCRCDLDGCEWDAIPSDLLHEHGCPKCGGVYRYTPETFVEKMAMINKNIVILDGYKTNKDKVRCLCLKCGNEWSTMPNTLLTGHGCPACKSSRGEKAVRDYLDRAGYRYVEQYTFDGCKHKQKLPFDFYIPDLNTAIEYNGEQHYKQSWYDYICGSAAAEHFQSQQLRDAIKVDYCKNNGIRLIVIPYTELKNINGFLSKELP